MAKKLSNPDYNYDGGKDGVPIFLKGGNPGRKITGKVSKKFISSQSNLNKLSDKNKKLIMKNTTVLSSMSDFKIDTGE